jgi:hypothetical protein
VIEVDRAMALAGANVSSLDSRQLIRRELAAAVYGALFGEWRDTPLCEGTPPDG